MDDRGEAIRLWDWPVRLIHWSFVLLLPALWWTWKKDDMPTHELRPQPTSLGNRSVREWDITDADPVSLDVYEKKAILRAIDTSGGDKLAAARLLQIGKSTLYRKLKYHNIR